MNSSEESPLSHPVIHSILFLAYVSVFLTATLGNAVILVVFISQRRARSVPNFFLANLTVADLLVAIFCVLQNGAHFVLLGHGHWVFGKFLCYTYIYTLHLIPNVSAGILVLVSVERLVAVLRPLRVRRVFQRKVLVSSSIVVWTASALMNFPYYFASQHMEFHDGKETFAICTRRHIVINDINVLKVVTTVNFVVWYAIPLLALLFIYATIGIVVSRAADISQSSIKGNKLLPKGSNDSRIDSTSGGVSIEKRRKVGRLALGIVSSFAICSLPRYVYLMWSVWRDPTAPRCLNCLQTILQPTGFLFLFLNSALNPFLYAFLSVRFRQCIKDTFYCNKRKAELIEMSSKANKRPPPPSVDTAYDDLH
ncbi:unnamed protein product [Auanema sp. JU1783]|nr:unnamed protein product [Auanema sp. JU1783]